MKSVTIMAASGILLTLAIAVPTQLPTVQARTYELDDFSFEIPKGCKVDKEKNRFETGSTHLDCGSNKEMVFEGGTNYGLVDMKAAPQSIVSELESLMKLVYGKENPEIFESGSDKYTINNYTAPYALATWTHTGHNLFGGEIEKDVAGMVIAIKIDDNKVALGQYLAPQEDFDKFLPKAESAFKSIKPIVSSPGNESGTDVSEDTNAG